MPQLTRAGVSHGEAPVVSYIQMSEEGLQRDLGRIEGKLDAVIERLDRQDTKEDSQDRRLQSLERWRSGLAGAWGAVILLVTSLWAVTHGK